MYTQHNSRVWFIRMCVCVFSVGICIYIINTRGLPALQVSDPLRSGLCSHHTDYTFWREPILSGPSILLPVNNFSPKCLDTGAIFFFPLTLQRSFPTLWTFHTHIVIPKVLYISVIVSCTNRYILKKKSLKKMQRASIIRVISTREYLYHNVTYSI